MVAAQSAPRLLRAAGLRDVRLEAVPLLFRGRAELEAIVPITFFAKALAGPWGTRKTPRLGLRAAKCRESL